MCEDGTTTRSCLRALVVVGLQVRTWDGGRSQQEQRREEVGTSLAPLVEGSGRGRWGVTG